ncbi:MAG: DUF3810 domain-containing protein, partial [Bacteroidales bacterium]|nr:DUF3810 domain-containing protein [Bacteroidales bacterium]
MRKTVFNLLPFLAALLVFAGVRAGIANPGAVEKIYSGGLYPAIAGAVSALSNLFSFSLWDVVWSVSVFLFLAGLAGVVLKKFGFWVFLLRAGQAAAVLYVSFYMLWGFNYFRQPMPERLGWAEVGDRKEVFSEVLDTLIFEANSNHCKVDASEYKIIDSLVEASYRDNGINLGLGYPAGRRFPKRMLFSSLFIRSDVSGYFGPLFNEVHINGFLLPVDFPFVAAHEKAHQFGIASEAEANLAAYVICMGSDDRRLRYSAAIHMLLYFMNDAYRSEGYHDYLKKIDAEVLDDLRKRSA